MTVLSQCNALEIRAAFRGESEQPQYGATQTFFLSLCRVFVIPCHRLYCKDYSFTTYGYGIFNVRTSLGACSTHERRGWRGDRHKQVCTRVDSEGQKNCASPCPARGLNPGSSYLNFDSLTRLSTVLIRLSAVS